MFARFFVVASLAALAVAGPVRLITRDGQCNTGPAQCCNSVQKASDATNLLDSVGLIGALAGINGLVGLNCAPIVGTGADCEQQPVCCEGNHFNGLINVGCSPVNIGA